MTFRSLLTSVKRAFHWNPLFFAETVVYTPFGGTARSINGHIMEEENLEFVREDTETRVRRIRVKVEKSATLGILQPNIGDTIMRDVAHDIDQVPYTYQGEHDFESVDSWRLVFERHRRDAEGFA